MERFCSLHRAVHADTPQAYRAKGTHVTPSSWRGTVTAYARDRMSGIPIFGTGSDRWLRRRLRRFHRRGDACGCAATGMTTDAHQFDPVCHAFAMRAAILGLA